MSTVSFHVVYKDIISFRPFRVGDPDVFGGLLAVAIVEFLLVDALLEKEDARAQSRDLEELIGR